MVGFFVTCYFCCAVQEALPQHHEWLKQQQKEGRLAFHGDFLNPEASNYGSGMYA
jgi:uncharacterized protein YciI